MDARMPPGDVKRGAAEPSDSRLSLVGFEDGGRHSAPQSSSIPREAKPVTFPVALVVVALVLVLLGWILRWPQA